MVKNNMSRHMFIIVMIMMVISIFATTRRESYNPWFPWNWFKKSPPRPIKPTRPREPPRPIKPFRPIKPIRPREPPRLIEPIRTIKPIRPIKPFRPIDPRLALIPEYRMGPPDLNEMVFLNRPAQPISEGARARMQSR